MENFRQKTNGDMKGVDPDMINTSTDAGVWRLRRKSEHTYSINPCGSHLFSGQELDIPSFLTFTKSRAFDVMYGRLYLF